MGTLVSARGDDHSPGANLATRCREHEVLAVRVQCGDRAVFLDWRVKRVRPALEVRYQLRERHESVWVRARVLGAGKVDAPVGGHQAERIPTSRPPRLGDST